MYSVWRNSAKEFPGFTTSGRVLSTEAYLLMDAYSNGEYINTSNLRNTKKRSKKENHVLPNKHTHLYLDQSPSSTTAVFQIDRFGKKVLESTFGVSFLVFCDMWWVILCLSAVLQTQLCVTLLLISCDLYIIINQFRFVVSALGKTIAPVISFLK